MKLTKTPYFLALALLALACSKNEPSTEVYKEEYRFFVQGTAGEENLELYAGKDSYYLETFYSFTDSIVEMTGHLRSPDPESKEAFSISIRSRESIAHVQQFDPSKNLDTGHYQLRDASGFQVRENSVLLSFSSPLLAGQSYPYQWVFPDGSMSYDPNPEKVVSLEDYQQYAVKLETSGAFNCESAIEHVINLKGDCDASFDLGILANFQAQVQLTKVQGEVSKVEWFHNGDSIRPDSLFGIFSLGNTGQPHTVTCVVHFADGCQKTIRRWIGANFAANCVTDFSYIQSNLMVYDPRQLATVMITYTSSEGKEYSSHYSNAKGNFKILSAQHYMLNEKGEPTTSFSFEADAVLQSQDGSSIDLKQVSGSFAVAHP